MSTLFVNTIYPDSGSSVSISGSLIISQSLIVADNITMSGSIRLGDSNTDSISLTAEISSSIIPDATITYNLGTTAKQWNKLHVANITASDNISSSGTVYGAVGQFDELSLPPFTSITASGGISATSFVGDGSQLTGVGSTGSILDIISISVDTFVSGAGTGSFNHFFVSGEISGSVSASGTGSFQGGVDAMDATGSFGYISASGDISAAGNLYFGSQVIGPGGLLVMETDAERYSLGNNEMIGQIDGTQIKIGTTTTVNGIQITGSISASTDISSSGTGSFTGGVDAMDATGSFGYISASGDISTSGNIFTENITIRGEVLTDISASGIISASGFAADGGTTSHFGTITSSGEITSITSSMDHLILSGSSSMGYMFISASDELNYTISSSGTISSSYFAGDGRYLFNVTASVGAATAHGSDKFIQFNDGGTNMGSDSGLQYNKAGLGILSVSGSIIVGNNTPGLGHISASRVSASAGFESDTLSTSSFGFISCSGDISSSGTGSFAGGIDCIGGHNAIDATGSFGYISCSGNISTSGNINAANGSFTTTVSASLLKGQSVQAQQGDSLGYRFNLNNDSVVNALRYKVISTVGHADINALPLTVTKDISGSANLLIEGNTGLVGTLGVTGSAIFDGALNMAGAFQIGGVAVTSTAAELNKMDGFIGTTTQLNTLIKTNDTAIEPSKAVKYDAEGAIRSKKVTQASSVTLGSGDSNALLIPTGGAAQTYTLPEVEESKGVKFEFIAGSNQTHRILAPSAAMFGQIIDNSNASTLARTNLEEITSIRLVNPRIGDRITIISDGNRYFIEGRTNDTPSLA